MNLDGLPFVVQPMEIEDVPTVSLIEHVVFTLPWSSTAFTYELRNNPSSHYLVLCYLPWEDVTRKRPLLGPVRKLLGGPRNDVSLLGYGGFWMMLEEAHICTLALRPEWRGRNLGELLLASLIEESYQRDAQFITLEVRVSNTVAQNLYKKYGFQHTGRRKGYYSDNGEDAHIMSTAPIHSSEYQERFQQLVEQLLERLRAQPDQPPELEGSMLAN
ncbi:MAG: ribosomal protein S18-alanine N-acetyltransferase [Anaerolineae bacterium]